MMEQYGAQSVMTLGVHLMLKWYADNWDLSQPEPLLEHKLSSAKVLDQLHLMMWVAQEVRCSSQTALEHPLTTVHTLRMLE